MPAEKLHPNNTETVSEWWGAVLSSQKHYSAILLRLKRGENFKRTARREEELGKAGRGGKGNESNRPKKIHNNGKS